MDRRPDEFCFAAVGDVHGHMHRMVRCVQDRAACARRVPAFVLHGLRAAWLPGIHREERFQAPRPRVPGQPRLTQVSGGIIREHTG